MEMKVESSIKAEDILNTELEASLNKSTFDSNIAESIITVDLGHLLAFDPRPINSSELKKNKESFLLDLCTQSTQLIVNNLFKLPQERVEDTIIVKLPKPTIIIPREKPLPKKKPLTKWEQYAKLKGITKKKKGRKVFDEVAKEWKPVWGMNRAKDTTKDWLIEIPKNQDPNQDFFAKRTTEKNERVAKNELQRLRNIARNSKKKVPGIGTTPTEMDKDKTKSEEKFHIKKALNMARTADASMSKFSTKLKDEDKTTRGFGKKRKFDSNYGSLSTEKERQIKLFEKLTSNRDKSSKEKLHIEKAANQHIREENNSNPPKEFRKGAGGKKGGKRRSDSGKHRRLGGKNKGRPKASKPRS